MGSFCGGGGLDQVAVDRGPSKVSGRPRSSGSASFSGMSALPRPRTSATGDQAAADGRGGRRGRPRARAARRSAARWRRPSRGRRRTSAGAAPAAAWGWRRWRRPSGPRRSTPPLITSVRLDAEEGRVPQHQVGELAGLDRADLGVEAVGDGRADGVLGDVAAGAEVVGAAVAGSAPRRRLHDVRGLPGADDRLADAAHGLRVGADHRDRAEVVQHVLGGHRRRPDPGLGEGQVLGDRRVEVVADHQHVEVLVERC